MEGIPPKPNPLISVNGTTLTRTNLDNRTTAVNNSNKLVLANKIATDEIDVEVDRNHWRTRQDGFSVDKQVSTD